MAIFLSLFLSIIVTTIETLTFPAPAHAGDSIPKYIISQKGTFLHTKKFVVTPDIPQLEDIDSLAIIEPSNLTDDPDISLQIHNLLVKYFLKTNRFKILERTRIDKILEEQKLSLTGIIDEKRASKIGSILGAKGILTGEVSLSGYSVDSDLETNKEIGQSPVYKVHLSLISVGKGELLWNEFITIIKHEAYLKPKTIEPYLHKLLLTTKTIGVKSARLLSHYDRVRGAGKEKYQFNSKDQPVLLLEVENAKYVTFEYSYFKRVISLPSG